MSEDRLQIKLTKRKPHKIYTANIKAAEHIEQLCKFLRKHKDKVLEVVINGKSTKFNSAAGRKRFASGFEHAFNITDEHVRKYIDKIDSEVKALNNKVTSAQQKAARLKQELDETRQRYITRHTIMDIRTAAWKDRVAELEDDREILKEEIKRLKNVKANN